MNKQMNEKALQEIAHQTETSEILFTMWAGRERDARNGITTIAETRRQLQDQGFRPVPQELLSTFKALAQTGAGEFQNGTFKWHTSLRGVAKLAVDGPGVISKPQSPAPTPEASSMLTVVLGTKRVYVRFPQNLTKEEAKTVAKILEEHVS